jgi:uncharacterized protein YjiS (DUF1127 family)
MNTLRLSTPLAWIGSGLTRIWDEVDSMMEVAATRRRLEEMDDRMLQDLGISRAQADFEASHVARRAGRRYF